MNTNYQNIFEKDNKQRIDHLIWLKNDLKKWETKMQRIGCTLSVILLLLLVYLLTGWEFLGFHVEVFSHNIGYTLFCGICCILLFNLLLFYITNKVSFLPKQEEIQVEQNILEKKAREFAVMTFIPDLIRYLQQLGEVQENKIFIVASKLRWFQNNQFVTKQNVKCIVLHNKIEEIENCITVNVKNTSLTLQSFDYNKNEFSLSFMNIKKII
ncbi:MAG: hypothetical protein WCH65_03480 [bacterium]